jgi:hypothetical protein
VGWVFKLAEESTRIGIVHVGESITEIANQQVVAELAKI